LLVGYCLAAGIGAGLQAQTPPPRPPRDVVEAPPDGPTIRHVPVGSAVLSGFVTARDTGRPLSGVRVTVIGTAEQPAARTGAAPTASVGLARATVTDALGWFEFARLPAGQLTVSAAHRGYLSASHGEPHPGGLARQFRLADGQRMSVNLQMARGGVITGMVIGEDGRPQANVQVRAWRYAGHSGVASIPHRRSIGRSRASAGGWPDTSRQYASTVWV
jgi:hypothetical protein